MAKKRKLNNKRLIILSFILCGLLFLVGIRVLKNKIVFSLNKNYASTVGSGESGTLALKKNKNKLKSSFLKNDSTAQGIVAGIINNYDVKNFQLTYGVQDGSGDTFAYRIVSAIRQLGYTQELENRAQGRYLSVGLLNKFQRLNGLPRSDFVTKDILLKLDKLLRDSEASDTERASKFPLYASQRMIDAPLNEPSKEHLSRILYTSFQALPSRLVFWNENNFKYFTFLLLRGSLGDSHGGNPDINGDYKFCSQFYYSEFVDNCVLSSNGKISTVNSDFEMSTLVLHEYAHFLDKGIYSLQPPKNTAEGIIDTRDFYTISYDISHGTDGPNPGDKVYPYRRGLSSRATEFVSSYATGWEYQGKFNPHEDFAESFVMYVSQGNVFRKLAKNNQYLAQKYQWLKQNVFGGLEYNTGNNAGIKFSQKHPTGSFGNLVFNVHDYSTNLPDFIWSYNFPSLNR